MDFPPAEIRASFAADFSGVTSMKRSIEGAAGAALLALLLAGCQTTKQPSAEAQAPAPQPQQEANATAPAASAASTAPAVAAAPGACVPGQFAIATVPPKPERVGDFFAGAAENVGRNVTRNVGTRAAQNMLGRTIPGVGGAIAVAAAPAVGQQIVQKAEDLWDDWTATDGSPACGCTVTFHKGALRADLVKSTGCASPQLQQIAHWRLGHSFTGYDAKLELLAADGRTIRATLNREGLDYFQGTLADGTPITLWR